MAATTGMDSPIPYDLRAGQVSSEGYFSSIQGFAEEAVADVEDCAAGWLDGYAEHVAVLYGETPRSRGEHAVEYLTLGLLMERYLGAAQASPYLLLPLLSWLCRLRRRFVPLKASIDALRGWLAGTFLVPHVGLPARNGGPGLSGLRRLRRWLRATGEFKDEVKRLENWAGYVAELPEPARAACLAGALEAFRRFRGRALDRLGPFTRGHGRFVSERLPGYRMREDELLCGKSEAEYHLNMIGAEIMNWGFRPAYDRAQRKVVLVPGCMRRLDAESCKARVDALDITCTGCSPRCNVARLTDLGRQHGFEVFIVPHSTRFSAWLERWRGRDGTALVAAACLPHLVPGGYEMRELGLAAQCVPLDFCGCRKHWHPEGIPTNLNESRLLDVVDGRARPDPASL
jgi:hypothetical protein